MIPFAVALALTGLGVISLARAATPCSATPAAARAGVFVGRIAAKGRTVVDPGDGTKLVLTRLTLRGTRLAVLGKDGPPPPDEELEVWFRGGVVSEDLGSFVADAPARHETRVGRWSVVRHRWSENLGILEDGTVLAGEVLEGGRAGLFTAFISTDGSAHRSGTPRDADRSERAGERSSAHDPRRLALTTRARRPATRSDRP